MKKGYYLLTLYVVLIISQNTILGECNLMHTSNIIKQNGDSSNDYRNLIIVGLIGIIPFSIQNIILYFTRIKEEKIKRENEVKLMELDIRREIKGFLLCYMGVYLY